MEGVLYWKVLYRRFHCIMIWDDFIKGVKEIDAKTTQRIPKEGTAFRKMIEKSVSKVEKKYKFSILEYGIIS